MAGGGHVLVVAGIAAVGKETLDGDQQVDQQTDCSRVNLANHKIVT